MKVIVKPHSVQVISTPVNEQEINVTKVEFEFSEEITDSFVKEAYFTLDSDTYKQVIVNNECEIPSEVLTKVGTIELGVVAYLVENGEEIVRYNPKPGYFTSWEGSLKDAENSQPITPSEMEQYEQALQDGLTDLDYALADLEDKVESGYFDGQDGRDGTDGITPTIGDNGNWYLGSTDTGKPSRGEKGLTGDTGATGSPGVDGYSPTASVSKSGNTATITITDKNGTTTTTVTDGTNGTNGRDGYVQYTAGENITIENNVISASGGGSSYTAGEGIDITNDTISSTVPVYSLISTYFSVSDWPNNNVAVNLTSADIEKLTTIIRDAYSKGHQYISLILSTGNNFQNTLMFTYGRGSERLTTKPTAFSMLALTTGANTLAMNDWISLRSYILRLTITWSGDEPTVTSATVNGVQASTLSTTNNYSYTPSNNYNPATKKYVDDSISNKIWIGTQAEYDALGTYNANTLYFIKES